ncbi:hypothetical protein J4G48_0046930 [Bradyrhizobium barranii subsp. apii]|uniref:hypothetical protein n=1 Tax=Bradyrhizobium barranii TaxID=2992140 RepID=UPI001AA12E8C|nr:hypothetical protein [Bradyrhizobium barranii]UPT96459.1 hypothetical protein J4G48_0046930 [Bradyrhizobium barranii subsp. apii]
MDWFERLTGFREINYKDTQSKLALEGSCLRSAVNGKRYDIGKLELISVSELRERVKAASVREGKLKVSCVSGDVRLMHRKPENAGALFQVASQFNLLEMVGPEVTPESGVTRYQNDRTQGPACAIAAGAATIYRNYFAPVGSQLGQTASCQLDGLMDVGQALSERLALPVSSLWDMKNGYALCEPDGLRAITAYLIGARSDERDALCGKLRIGFHEDVEVTDGSDDSRPRVSQIFCSALPVAYRSEIAVPHWEALARLVLEAAYEATILCGILNAARAKSNRVLLTALGGGAFGNDERWICDAIVRALQIAKHCDLDVRLVSFGHPTSGFLSIEKRFE